jgi:type IV secretion system protein VirB11
MTTPIAQLQHMLEPLTPLLEGGTEDIAINEPHLAWACRRGKWLPFEMPTLDHDTLVDMTILAAAVSEQTVSKRHPLLFTDVPMSDGPQLRLLALLPPAVEPGMISWTLRQPGDKIHGVKEITGRYKTERWNKWQRRGENRDHTVALALYDAGDIERFLSHIVKARYNVLLCGATGSSKTTMGITCISEIPEDERIITIENAREYRLNQRNKVHLIYSQGEQGTANVTQKDLQRASMRARPDRVLVQELLDGDAAETYVTEVISGHPGSITTIHGRSPSQAFKKLFTMVKSSKGGGSQEDATVVSTLSSVIDVIMPFHNEGGVFSIGETFFAPDAARRGETAGDLLRDIW